MRVRVWRVFRFCLGRVFRRGGRRFLIYIGASEGLVFVFRGRRLGFSFLRAVVVADLFFRLFGVFVFVVGF